MPRKNASPTLASFHETRRLGVRGAAALCCALAVAQVAVAPHAQAQSAPRERAADATPAAAQRRIRTVDDPGATSLESPRAVERPWAEGVTVEQQEQAARYFAEGNALLRDSFFKPAAEKYVEALRSWDHPGIRYNLALALLNLGQSIEAYEQLNRAVVFGPAPLDADKISRANSYIKLLQQQLATIEVACDQAGAEVRLNGRVLFRAPGRYTGIVQAGENTVTASKPGYETTQLTRVLKPKQTTALNVRLYRPEELIGYRRRWPIALPLAVTAGGALATGAAVLFSLRSAALYKDFDASVASRASCKEGCHPDHELQSTKDRAKAFRTVATVSYIAGGTALAAGLVMFGLNQRVSFRIQDRDRGASLSISPAAAPGALGLAARGTF